MLGKLLKYEFKSTSRLMWILYAAVIACGAIFGLVIRTPIWKGDTTFGPSLSVDGFAGFFRVALIIAGLLYLLLMVAMMVLTIVMIILRFYRNLLGGEGYLMHTLPVKTWQLVASKLITAIVWIIIASLAATLSFFMLSLTSGVFGYVLREQGAMRILHEIAELFREESATVIAVFVLMLTSCLLTVMTYYFAMALGNLANAHKLLFAFLAYLGIQTVSSVVFPIFAFNAAGFRNLMYVSSGIAFALSALYFAGTTLILNKKLNLA